MYRLSDILIRKTGDGETLWLSQRLIVECCGISQEYLRVRVRPSYKQSLPSSWQMACGSGDYYLGDTGKSWRWGHKAGQYYYDYDRIPNKAPVNYRSMLPSKDKLIAIIDEQNLHSTRERTAAGRKMLLEAVALTTNNEDAAWIQSHSGYMVDIVTARNYATALAWCRLIKQVTTTATYQIYGATTVETFYAICVDAISTQKIKKFLDKQHRQSTQ